MPEVIQSQTPPPAPPPGPAQDLTSEATAMARLRALRPAPTEQQEQDQAPPASGRAADGKFSKRAPDPEPVADQAQDEAAPDAEASEAEDAAPEKELSSIHDLAEHLGVDVSDLYNLRVPVEIDGQKVEVALGEFKDGYRAKTKIDREQQEIQTKKAEFEQWQTSSRQRLEAAEQAAANVLQRMQQQLLSDYQSVDWQTLRATDPGEYAARQADFQQRDRAFRGLVDEAVQQVNGRRAQLEQETESAKQETRKREHAALRDAVREWRDPNTYQRESKDLFEYATKHGYSPNEVNAFGDHDGDHRVVSALRKAMLYDQAAAKAKASMKPAAVKIGQKVIKPGPRANATGASADAKKAIATARQTGDWRDALTALKATRRTKS